MEKAAVKQIQDHSDRNNNTPGHQSTYKVNHSCETALLFLCNEILTSFEKQEIINLYAINLSVAFDTVDHGIMISTMENTFGLSGNTLSWLSSYLTPCSFNVSIEGNMSVDKPVTFSVPQGSVVGPILCNFYVGSLPDCIKHDGVLINRFTDDICFIIPIKQVISVQTNSIRILEGLPLQCEQLNGAKQASHEPLQDGIHLLWLQNHDQKNHSNHHLSV